ncbi:peptidoglycan editing factor PgeF [Lentibacillus sediminis]|uniref:peptidoglycan editing factor PgeF n=1 Tax=Lentibacillus sediminis TaxID=1940529 RepID=UPI000C1C58E3|nr:peptidoglycan editing factor PgeF [Lentibacillus sediminis]
MREPFQQENHESFLTIKKWQEADPRLKAGFTTRNGGVSPDPFTTLNLGLHVSDEKEKVLTNRQMLAENLEMPLTNWAAGEQIHQTNVEKLSRSDRGRGSTDHQQAIKGTDGFITKERGILCTAFFADCVPLFFFDPETGFIGIAHAGWKGTVNRMAEQMVEKLTDEGVNLKSLLVCIGPCISRGYYEVDEQVIRQIPAADQEKVITVQGEGRFLLDLKQLNVEILLQAGVLRNNIDVTTYCTYREESLFFSHRRDKGKTGRMLGFIGYSR